jgi:hypothetical protein
MWSKVFDKQLWANISAVIVLSLIAIAIALYAWDSWKKNIQMERQVRQVCLLARGSPQIKSVPVDTRALVEVLNEVAPCLQSPFAQDHLVRVILCNEEKELTPPKDLELNPCNYIGLGHKGKHLYLVLWDHAGKVRHQRRIDV